jgi:hypothetical protein
MDMSFIMLVTVGLLACVVITGLIQTVTVVVTRRQVKEKATRV